MLEMLVIQLVPSRIYELHKCLFGVFNNQEPFWGVHEKLTCGISGDELHVLFIDGQMITIIDQVVRQLYVLLDPACVDDLVFRKPTLLEQNKARKILARMVFRHPVPLLKDLPPSSSPPYLWLTESMRLAYTFLVIHETSHQGPQEALGPALWGMHIPFAKASAKEIGIELSEKQAISWAKELYADLNAFLIISTAAYSQIEEKFRDHWSSALFSGVALALGVWDLILRECCYGNALLARRLIETHPPAHLRFKMFVKSALRGRDLGAYGGESVWAERILTAIEDLHE